MSLSQLWMAAGGPTGTASAGTRNARTRERGRIFVAGLFCFFFTWGVRCTPGARREVVRPQVGLTWGREFSCEAPVRPHPPPCPG